MVFFFSDETGGFISKPSDIDEKSQLQEEFTDYQLTPLDELSKCLSSETDIATFWGEMTKLHDIFQIKLGLFFYQNLQKLCLFYLTVMQTVKGHSL